MRRNVADHRALIEQAGEGVIALDNTERILMCNSTASEILGSAVGDLPGPSFQTFVPLSDLSMDPKSRSKNERSGMRTDTGIC